MRGDMDLIREILLTIEAKPAGKNHASCIQTS
jgi:hypothetical protein